MIGVNDKTVALAKQFVTFAIVGVVNTIISFSTYAFFTRVVHLHPLVANLAAFIIAVTCSFLLNRRYTFRGSIGQLHHQYAKFLVVNIAGLGISETIIWFLHVRRDVNDLLAFAIATILVLFWNFSLNRWWTFKTT